MFILSYSVDDDVCAIYLNALTFTYIDMIHTCLYKCWHLHADHMHVSFPMEEVFIDLENIDNPPCVCYCQLITF